MHTQLANNYASRILISLIKESVIISLSAYQQEYHITKGSSGYSYRRRDVSSIKRTVEQQCESFLIEL